MARHRDLKRGGFTLVEVAVVAAIALTLLFLAMPVIQGSDTLGAAARTLSNDCLRTRSMARARWEPVTLDFDIPSGRWRKVAGGAAIVDQDTDANGWKSPPEDVSFQAVPGTQDVVFQANGRVEADTSIRIVNDDGDAWQLDFSALSGRITATKI